jgi:8-oxo-dGTP pyrophosphatase MutT (NUDIX family)
MKTKNPAEDVLVGEDLYHVTWLKHLPSIQANGLQPGDSGNFRAYAFHASNKLFLCEADALPYWWNKFTEMVDIGTAPDNWHELDHIPIVLRVAYVEGLHLADDALGSRDSNYDAYYIEQTIPPEDLSVFSVASDGWENLDDADAEELKNDMEYAFLEVSEDGATWIEADWDALEPEPLEYTPDKGTHAGKTQNPVSDVVYHRTSLFALGKILEENRFLTTIAFGREGEYKHARNQSYFFSTSRSPDATYGGGSVTLVLDGRKFNYNYKGSAVDYWNAPWKRTAEARSKQNELEDRVLTNKPYIPNAAKYITAIHISVEDREKKELRWSQHFHKILHMAETRGIPVSLYSRHKSYRKLDPRRSVGPEGAPPGIAGPAKERRVSAYRDHYGTQKLADYLKFVLYGTKLPEAGEEYKDIEGLYLTYYYPRGTQPSDAANNLNTLLQNARADSGVRPAVNDLIRVIRRTKQPDLQSFVEYIHGILEADENKRVPTIWRLSDRMYNIGMAWDKRDPILDAWKEQGLTYDQQEALVSKLEKAYTGKTQNPVDYVEPARYWGSVGAGIVAVARSTGRVLMQLRSAHVDQPLTWGVVGGKLDANESNLELVAGREFKEETGYHGELSLAPAYKFVAPGGNFTYQNYIGLVDHEFMPVPDWETKRFAWMELEDALRVTPMHFGLKVLLDDEESFKLLYAATEAA